MIHKTHNEIWCCQIMLSLPKIFCASGSCYFLRTCQQVNKTKIWCFQISQKMSMNNYYLLFFRDICFKCAEIWYIFTFILVFENDTSNGLISISLQNWLERQLLTDVLQNWFFENIFKIYRKKCLWQKQCEHDSWLLCLQPATLL